MAIVYENQLYNDKGVMLCRHCGQPAKVESVVVSLYNEVTEYSCTCQVAKEVELLWKSIAEKQCQLSLLEKQLDKLEDYEHPSVADKRLLSAVEDVCSTEKATLGYLQDLLDKENGIE